MCGSCASAFEAAALDSTQITRVFNDNWIDPTVVGLCPQSHQDNWTDNRTRKMNRTAWLTFFPAVEQHWKLGLQRAVQLSVMPCITHVSDTQTIAPKAVVT